MRLEFNLRPLIPILVACAALVFLCAGVGGAFMILAAIPFLGVWLLYSGYIIWRRHEKRRVQVIRVGILTATLVGIAALHFYYYTSARAAGDYAERLVSAYKAKHGTYPVTLEEAGWKLGAYGGRWRIVYQGNGERPLWSVFNFGSGSETANLPAVHTRFVIHRVGDRHGPNHSCRDAAYTME
jgi:hypothetical protein